MPLSNSRTVLLKCAAPAACVMCCTRVQSPQEERQPAKHNPRGRQQPAPRCARAARSGPARVVVGLLVVLTPLQVTGYGLKCRSLALSHDGATQLSFQVSTYGMTNWVYVAEDDILSYLAEDGQFFRKIRSAPQPEEDSLAALHCGDCGSHAKRRQHDSPRRSDGGLGRHDGD